MRGEDSAMVFCLVLVGFLVSAVDVLGFVAPQLLVVGFAAFVPPLHVAMGKFPERERSRADEMSHL